MYTVKQAQEILKAEPVDLFEKAHKVGDIHPNGKWVWKEIKPGKFDWRVIGGRRNKKSAAAGGSSNDSKSKTQLSGSKPSLSYARQYSTSGNAVTFTPVKDSGKTTTNTLPKEPLDAQEKKYLLWKEAGPASNLSSINLNFKREVTSTEEGLHVFKGENDWFEITVKKDGNKFVYTLYRVDGLPKVKRNELEKHSAIAATVTSDKQIKVAKTFYKKLFS